MENKPRWTENQKCAIDAHCADNLVSAAAGSGKTAVMVERIVDKVVTGKVDIDKILVVTFTNAAASELKSRLMSNIMSALDSSNNSDRLNRQLMLINTASICTIDSFCLNVLKNNFFKLNLDPSLKLADSAEIELMKNDAVSKVFEDYYNLQDSEFLRLVDCYTVKNDSELEKVVRSIYEFTNSMPDGIKCLEKFAQQFADNSVWNDYFVKTAHSYAKSAIKYYDYAIEETEKFPEFEKALSLLYSERNNFDLILERNKWNDILQVVKNFEFGTLRFPSKTPSEQSEIIKFYREAGKNYRKSFSKLFYAPFEQLCEDAQAAYRDICKFVEITTTFAMEFQNIKQKKGVIDFNDVEHFTLEILSSYDGKPSAVANQIMDKYDEIYVDEYQDCNLVQETIFSLISKANMGKPNMFMVGDMKQSIYGFRGSEPALFKDKADRYPLYSAENLYNKILLNMNFRSRKCIINGVNSIFSQIMSEQCGELNYNNDEFLYTKDTSENDFNPDLNNIDIALFETSNTAAESDDSEDAYLDMKGIEAEAIYVANRIKKMVENDNKPYYIEDSKTGDIRRIRYSDIAVLLRSGKAKADIFNQYFTLAQIPAYCENAGGYYDTPEIEFVINFLKIIDNPLDDIALLSVMRHPVFGFTDDDFVSIRAKKKRGYYYHSCLAYKKGENDELAVKVSEFFDLVSDFYDKSRYLPAHKLLKDMIDSVDYMSYLSFMSNSELRKANVRSLLTKAYEFEKSSYKGVFEFIRYIDSICKNNNDVEPAKILSDDEDVVRIMTIHKSKGLEFPVVFLCDCGKLFNTTDLKNSRILVDKDYGFGACYFDAASHYYYELPQMKMLKDVKYNKLISEEMRVLYVAMTRPKDKLIITGSLRNIDGRINSIKKLIFSEEHNLSSSVVLEGKSYLDWILMAVLRNSFVNKEYAVKNPTTVICDGSRFQLEIFHKSDEVLKVESNYFIRDFAFSEQEDCKSNVEDILNYEYPYRTELPIPSNMSVTELKRLMNDDVEPAYYQKGKLSVPVFCEGRESYSAAEIGTFTHLVMEKLDLTKISEPKEIEKQIEMFVEKGFLLENQVKYINTSNICNIFKTPIGLKLIEHVDTLKREFSFKYMMEASEIYNDAYSDEHIVVQGMIDAYFEDENGDIVVIDYKTDKVTDGVESLKERYKQQLKYYRIAIEKALGKRVSGTYLMLLDAGVALEVNTY